MNKWKRSQKINFLTNLSLVGVNFIKVLWEMFARADPESAKKTVKMSIFIALLGSVSTKAASRMLMKLTPDGRGYPTFWSYTWMPQNSVPWLFSITFTSILKPKTWKTLIRILHTHPNDILHGMFGTTDFVKVNKSAYKCWICVKLRIYSDRVSLRFSVSAFLLSNSQEKSHLYLSLFQIWIYYSTNALILNYWCVKLSKINNFPDINYLITDKYLKYCLEYCRP